MIAEVELRRFRGFHHVLADLLPHAFVSGPNSAGKSTILEAIALAENCLRVARRQNYHHEAWRDGIRLVAIRPHTQPDIVAVEDAVSK